MRPLPLSSTDTTTGELVNLSPPMREGCTTTKNKTRITKLFIAFLIQQTHYNTFELKKEGGGYPPPLPLICLECDTRKLSHLHLGRTLL